MSRKNLDERTMVTLVRRAQAGEQAAFSVLVQAHADRIFNYLLRMVGDREEAEDLAQETFLRAWQSMNRFRGGAAFSTWLYRIATNLAIDALRRRKRRGHEESLDQPLEHENGEQHRDLPDPDRPPDEQVIAGELQQIVWAAIGKMSPKLRAVLIMYDFEQLTYEEIAQALRVPLGTVKSRLFNARKQLKSLLEQTIDVEEYLGMLESELSESS